MRIAVLILALCLSLPFGGQSMAVYIGASVAHNELLAEAASVGVLSSILFIIGGAFAVGLPRFSQALFILAAILCGCAVSISKDFADMPIWAGASLLLATLSYLGVRELKTKSRNEG